MKYKIVVGIAIFLLIGICVFFYPKIKLNGNEEVIVNIGEVYAEQGASSRTLLNNNKNVKINGKVNTSKIGKYEVTYTAKKFIFSTKKKRKVIVVDKVQPTIKLTGGEKIVVCPGKKYEEQGYTALDNYDGDITANVSLEELEEKIIYTVSDNSKNKTEIIRNIVYEDKTFPEIKLKGNKTVNIYVGGKYTESGYTATDNCDGDLSKKVVIVGKVNTKKVGTYKLTYQVTDKAGNTTKAVRTINVSNKAYSKYDSVYKKGTIYLTFDDGPSSSTSKVLDVLKKYNVKATFFVINTGSTYDNMIKRAYNEGHTIAVHGWSHNYKTIYSSQQAFLNSVNKMNEKIKRLTGEESRILRFPGGSSNTVSRNYNRGIMTLLTNKMLELGYVYFDWNVGSSDTNNISSKRIYNNVINGLSKSRINVVLMHDYAGQSATINALPNIIKYGLDNGYVFEKITTQTPMVTHTVAN